MKNILKNGVEKEILPVEPEETASPTSSVAINEKGGRKGLEPTRYGDWEKKGRCIDF